MKKYIFKVELKVTGFAEIEGEDQNIAEQELLKCLSLNRQRTYIGQYFIADEYEHLWHEEVKIKAYIKEKPANN